MNIVNSVKPEGIIVQFGGQTPLNLAKWCSRLQPAGAPLIGTSPDESIDRAEDREHFSVAAEARRPAATRRTASRARRRRGGLRDLRAHRLSGDGAPSYVLGGRAMEIVYNDESLDRVHDVHAVQASPEHPVLVDKLPRGRDRGRRRRHRVTVPDVVVAGVMEHIEEAGVHSGDSACVLPPPTLDPNLIEEIKRQATKAMALELEVVGLMNVQFAVKGENRSTSSK